MDKRITFDYSKLKGRMKEKNYTQEKAANDLNISKSTFSFKINSKSYFTQYEIFFLMNKLDIKKEEMSDYFFVLLV